MNALLIFGALVLVAYLLGRVFEVIQLPRIVAYILVGVVASPNTLSILPETILADSDNILSFCLAVITFEVGGELKWENLQKSRKEILSITLLASIIPFLLIVSGYLLVYYFFSSQFNFSEIQDVLAFSLLLAALASPTDPSATLAVIHQYKFEGKVKDVILGVAALDDGFGIVLFSLTMSLALLILGGSGSSETGLMIGAELILSVLIGVIAGLLFSFVAKYLKISSEGQWIIVILSAIAITAGIAQYFEKDELLSCLVFGLVFSNTSSKSKLVFSVIQRYTEELIFLVFFLLSGFHLKIFNLQESLLLIVVFVVLRITGKYVGAWTGGKLVHASNSVNKRTGGGLVAQGGIVIGMALLITRNPQFDAVSNEVLTVIMGATIIHEIIGPLLAKRSLEQAIKEE